MSAEEITNLLARGEELFAERQSLQTLQPGQSGWGAAQRRLRAIAPEIARLEALAARQADERSDPEQAPTALDAVRSEERRSPAAEPSIRRVGGSSASEAAGPEQIARRQRLIQLQGELAQLKKTPSMQLLARQRIPRLEEAIKHLIASLAESA